MIIFQDNFANLNNWNATQSSGTVVASSNAAVFSAGAGGFDTLGLTLKTANVFNPYAFWTVTFVMNQSSTASCNFMMGLYDNNTLAWNAGTRYTLYIDGGGNNAYSYDGGSTTSLGFSTTASADHTIQFLFNPDQKTASIYYDGLLKSTSVNFGSGWDVFTHDMYFQFNVDQVNGSSGTLSIKNFVIDDNSSISNEISLSSGSGYSVFQAVDLGVQAAQATALSAGTTYYLRNQKLQGTDAGPYSSVSSTSTSAASTDDDAAKLLVLGEL